MKIRIILQCMVKSKQLNDQYLGNLALKINLKVHHHVRALVVLSVMCTLTCDNRWGVQLAAESEDDASAG